MTRKYPAIIYKNNTLPDGIEIEVSRALVDLVKKSDGPAFHVFIEEEVYEPEFHTAHELLDEIEKSGDYPDNELTDNIQKAHDEMRSNGKYNIGFSITPDKRFMCQSCEHDFKSLLNLGRHYEEKHLK